MSDEILDLPASEGNKKNIDEVIENGYEFKFSQYIQEGYDLAKKNLGLLVVFTLVYSVILGLVSFIPFGAILITGPLTAGFFIAANKLKFDEPLEFGDFFKGFNHFMPLFLASLVTGIFIVIGIFAFVIPGIYLAIAYGFVTLIIVFHGHEFWDSMEYSRKVIVKIGSVSLDFPLSLD
jgi:hypothetical protein